ncbi:MAG: Crp/Fnr family transcriptional regulator [Pseudomonadota bacterium]
MSLSQNQLIARLPDDDRLSLLAICEQVALVQQVVLAEEGEPVTHVYFPIRGFISLAASVQGSIGVEVGMVGAEGVLGAQVGFGTPTAQFQSHVQGPGTAWRVQADAFCIEIARSGSLRRLLNKYLYVVTVQLATSAACMHFHQIGPRLARWLLMCQDRTRSDTFQITHESLAATLGVRRVGVTTAASAFQRADLIRYHRGVLSVLDRKGLEAASCGCYEVNEKAYAQLLA